MRSSFLNFAYALIRSWLDHRSWSLYPCWDSCQRAFRTSSDHFIFGGWNSCCFFSVLLCGALEPLPFCWKRLSLLVYMCRRRVFSYHLFRLLLSFAGKFRNNLWSSNYSLLSSMSVRWCNTATFHLHIHSIAWLVGWALILEYTIGGAAVARGISPNLVGLSFVQFLRVCVLLYVGKKLQLYVSFFGNKCGTKLNL